MVIIVGILYLTDNNMVKKIFFLVNYLAIIISIIYFSFITRVLLKFGNNYASRFSDPKEMGMNIHYSLAIPYSFVINAYLLLPFCIILLIYFIMKKELQRDTIILFVLNIFVFYFFAFYSIGPIEWLAD